MTDSSPLDQFDGVLLDGLDFCSKTYALFESIRQAPGGVTRLRLRHDRVAKRLLEELLPISAYVQYSYRLGRYISIRWQDGNQQVDAEIFQRGACVQEALLPAHGHLEVTCAVHPNDYLARELLETKGASFGLDGLRRLKGGDIESRVVSYQNHEFIDKFCEILLAQVAAKDRKNYPIDTTLVVPCMLNMLYFSNEWDTLISRAKAALQSTQFREIFLYDTTCNHRCSVLQRNNA